MSNYQIKDGNAALKTFKSSVLGTVNTPHHNIDALPLQHVDAFSRMRTSNPGYRFDSQLTYRIDADLWDTKVTGDGATTHDATNRMVAVVSGATAGANTAILQTHSHAPYTPGRSQLIFITFNMPSTVPTNGEVGCGYYDGSNGVYLKRTASGLTLNIDNTTSLANESAAQASWNIDPLDGSGPSGITLDVTDTNILVIQMQALYVGRVVVAFDIGGNLVPVHEFNHANSVAYPYIAQASLPIRYWANTSTDSGSATINAICCSVISEGGEDLEDIPGRQFVASGSLTDASPKIAAVVIRPKSTLNSITSNVIGIPTELDVAIATAGAWIEVRRNATVTAGTFTDIDALSSFEASFAGNAGTDPAVTADTGTLVDKFYVPASAQNRTSDSQGLIGKAVLTYSHLLATADNLAIIIDGGSTTDAFVSLKWKEIR